MKSVFSILFFMVATLCLFAEVEEIPGEDVAVFQFYSKQNRRQKEAELLRKITYLQLKESGRFNLISSDEADESYGKYGVSGTSYISATEALMVGRKAGYDWVVIGSIEKLDLREETAKNRVVVTLRISLQSIECSSGFMSEKVRLVGIAYQSLNTVIYPKALSQAKKKAFESISGQIGSSMNTLFPLSTYIAAVSNELIRLPLGSFAGIRKNDRFRVYPKKENSSTKKNPEPLGTIKVVALSNNTSYAELVRGDSAPLGSRVKKIRQAGLAIEFFTSAVLYRMDEYSLTTNFQFEENYDGEVSASVDIPQAKLAVAAYIRISPALSFFQPTFDMGFLFPNGLTVLSTEMRLSPGINFSIAGDSLQFKLLPFMGINFASGEVGKFRQSFTTDDGNTIEENTPYNIGGMSFGTGLLTQLKFQPSDSFGLSLGGGYRYYGKVSDWKISSLDKNEELVELGLLSNTVGLPELDISGFEFDIGLYFIF